MKSNTEPVTMRLPRNEMRLLIPAIMDRMTMMAHDRSVGRLTQPEYDRAFAAHDKLLTDLRKAVK